MTIEYFQRDERPYWVATVEVEGAFDDMSTGYTFEVNLDRSRTPAIAPALTKTTGITGGPGGVVTVAWVPNDLDLDPATYYAQLTVTRSSDNKDWTIEDKIKIRPRMT